MFLSAGTVIEEEGVCFIQPVIASRKMTIAGGTAFENNTIRGNHTNEHINNYNSNIFAGIAQVLHAPAINKPPYSLHFWEWTSYGSAFVVRCSLLAQSAYIQRKNKNPGCKRAHTVTVLPLPGYVSACAVNGHPRYL